MSTKNHIILIHGTWCNGENWGDFASEMERRGFTVHIPTLRHHGHASRIDVKANAEKVAKVGLLDYVADLSSLADSLDSPPIILGHSLGGLIAQLLAARRPNKGVILLGTAPSAGMSNLYPSMIRIWMPYLFTWLFRKPMYPCPWSTWIYGVVNEQPPDIQESYYKTLCAESGRAYFEMALWYLDPRGAARVDFDAIKSPVLVIGGSRDLCTVPQIGRLTSKRYGEKGTYVELEGSDHMMTIGHYMPKTFEIIDRWLEDCNLTP